MIHGEAVLALSIQAKLASLIDDVLPGLTKELTAVVNAVLPKAGGIWHGRARGNESETQLTTSPVTALSEQAAVENNEIRTAR